MKKLIQDIERKIFELSLLRKGSDDFEYKNFISGQEEQLEWVLNELVLLHIQTSTDALRSSTDRMNVS